jgi:hypothetical protein
MTTCLSARDCRDDAHLATVSYLGIETILEADVLAVDINVYEPPQLTVFQ